MYFWLGRFSNDLKEQPAFSVGPVKADRFTDVTESSTLLVKRSWPAVFTSWMESVEILTYLSSITGN